MKKTLLSVILLSPLNLTAQSLIFFGGVYSDFSMGFVTPAPLIGASGNISKGKIELASYFWASSADKFITHDGWTSWGQAAVFYRIMPSLGLGPGVLVRHTSTSGWEKTSVYPSFGVVKNFPLSVRITGMAHFRDQWTQNNGRGGSVNVELGDGRLKTGLSVTMMKFTLLSGDTSPHAGSIVSWIGYDFHRSRK